MRILILCTGNSCRSQMAHGFLQSFDNTLEICSAGTQSAEHVNTKAIAVMQEIGIDISSYVPHNVIEFLDQEWDYVITVCDNANETCPIFIGQVKQRLHIGFDDPSEAVGNSVFVEKEFRRVRDEIKKQFYNLYLHVISKTYIDRHD